MSHQGTLTETVTAYPSGFDSTNSAYASATDVSNGYNSSDNSSNYAQFNLVTGSGAHTWVYYTFNMSAIPDTATITSVACTVRSGIGSWVGNNIIVLREIQMYTNTEAKGTPSSFNSYGTYVTTLSPGDNWTVSEIKNAKVVSHIQRGSMNTSNAYSYNFYGATLTVGYTFEGTFYEISSSSTIPNTKGVLVDTEYQEQPATASITITNTDGLNLMINDNNSKTASFTDTSYTYTLNNLNADHNIKIDYNATNFSKINNNWRSIAGVYQKSSNAWSATTFASVFPSGIEIKQGDDLLDEKPLVKKPLVKFLSNCDVVYVSGYADSETASSITRNFNYGDGEDGKTYYVLLLFNGNLGLHKLEIHLSSSESTSTSTSIIEYGSAGNKIRLRHTTYSQGGRTTVAMSSDGTSNLTTVYNGTMVFLKLKDTSPLTGSEFETLLSTTNGITGSYGVNSASNATRTDTNHDNYLPCYILTGQSTLFGLSSVNSSKIITSILGYNGTSTITNRSLIGLYEKNNISAIYYFGPTGSSRAYTNGGITFIYM